MTRIIPGYEGGDVSPSVGKRKGSVRFETEAGKGTAFIIGIPTGEGSPPAQPPADD